ncbi:MAG: HIT domain-containing protein [Candidatus Latescibacteria bacterium]|nr:HIT domain-containing protein [Candidatus Latescibacterota bacterium]NIM21035.1 HIT domain-containing protein [Candidatus Latescibacterota bacterium]NIM65170.1 HIT domain-containing protein [Candidatus Latescibacterota bacterium]NIO01685.1 HIT domain-containing protein [Candidatus Latescibacterota bacterium]NIO28202.1 HIT domain-containing protein [Candidatus Latescibacterota bacterium]
MKRIYAPWRYEYLISAKKEDECLFCELAKGGDVRSKWILHRGKLWYVVLNIYPYTSGHIMVVCNRHIESFSELTPEENTEFMGLMSRSEKAIKKAYRPHGINVGANLGRSAGAGIVGHLHIHLVPRWHGDTNYMTAIGETRVVSEDLEESYEKLKSSF